MRSTPPEAPHGTRATDHSFTFGTGTVRMLALLAPGGIEEHFRSPAFSEPAAAAALPPSPGGPADVAAFATDLAGYGVEIVGPPGPPEQR